MFHERSKNFLAKHLEKTQPICIFAFGQSCMKNLLISIWLLCLLTGLNAQTPFHRIYDGRMGLPSSEVYDAVQDEKGYLWFSTDHGLARFDGYQFRTYDIQDGLPENSVFYFRKDTKGRIWFNTYDGMLGYIQDDEVHPYQHKEKLAEFVRSAQLTNYAVFHSFYVDEQENAHFFIQKTGSFVIHADGRVSQSSDTNSRTLNISFDRLGKAIFSGSGKMLFDSALVAQNGQSYHVDLAPMKSNAISRNLSAVQSDTSVYLAYNQRIAQISGGKIRQVVHLSHYIVSMQLDRFGRIWALTLTGGAFIFDSSLHLLNHFFDGESFSGFVEDHEGGIWLTSLNRGIFYIPDHQHFLPFQDLGFPKEPIVDVDLDDKDCLWVVFYSGKIGCYARNAARFWDMALYSGEFVVDLLYDSCRKRTWVATNKRLMYVYDNQLNSFTPKYDNQSDRSIPAIKSLALDKQGCTLWLGLFYGIANVSQHDTTTLVSALEGGFHERVECIETDGKQVVWAGSTRGLYCMKDGRLQNLGEHYHLLKERITALRADGDTLWIGTRGNGLLRLTPDTLLQYTTTEGLPSNSVKAIQLQDDCVLVGTNNGLSVLSKKNGQLKPFRQMGNMELLSKEVIQLLVHADTSIVLTKGGVSYFKGLAGKTRYFEMPVMIRSVMVNEKVVSIHEPIKLNSHQNRLIFEYFGISFVKTGKHTYRHRLLGLEKEWVVNQQTVAQYPFLPAGTYRFEVEVHNPDGSWSASPATFSFVISRPFWQTWWFISLSVASLLLIFLLFFKMYDTRQKKERLLLSEINRYHQQALANQMNPHFIFNALNTVQRYILENDKISSSKYLSTFANLMRQMLNIAQEKHISVRNEMEVLKVYIEMEMARYKDTFTYSIVCEPPVNADKTFIPVFFIQPLAENAIKHGLINSGRPGKLSVRFYGHNNELVCEVQDNGIGRAKAAELASKLDKSSLGVSIIQKRISLINQSAGTSIRLEYTDLFDAENNPAGTRAAIIFPDVVNKAEGYEP